MTFDVDFLIRLDAPPLHVLRKPECVPKPAVFVTGQPVGSVMFGEQLGRWATAGRHEGFQKASLFATLLHLAVDGEMGYLPSESRGYSSVTSLRRCSRPSDGSWPFQTKCRCSDMSEMVI